MLSRLKQEAIRAQLAEVEKEVNEELNGLGEASGFVESFHPVREKKNAASSVLGYGTVSSPEDLGRDSMRRPEKSYESQAVAHSSTSVAGADEVEWEDGYSALGAGKNLSGAGEDDSVGLSEEEMEWVFSLIVSATI